MLQNDLYAQAFVLIKCGRLHIHPLPWMPLAATLELVIDEPVTPVVFTIGPLG